MHMPINSFPGYEFKQLEDGKFHNMYRGVDLGKGGWVYSKPGIYTNVALLDAASMHPASIIALNKLGKYTQRYADLRQARVYIKHGDYEAAGKLFDGKLKKYLGSKEEAKALSKALKLPLNAFFGVSFASFENPAKDSRDNNNIIALRGALFMKTLFDEVNARGFEVVHGKTDSLKIPNATPEIIQFVQEFGKKYDYEMEHEATYERMCLIDKAQYVATFMRPEECEKLYGYIPGDNRDHFAENSHPWTTTGDEFQRPYIFKTLFSGEEPTFDDCCETNSVKDAAIYLDFNEKLPNVEQEEAEMEKRQYNKANPDKKPKKLSTFFLDISDEKLQKRIDRGHDYHFVGRVGRFYPIKPGCGGGWLIALRNGKYSSVSGSKGYRWMEAELVKAAHKEGDLDPRYHNAQVTEAIAAINKFGSYEEFVDLSKPYPSSSPLQPSSGNDILQPSEDDELPFDLTPCGDNKYNNCMECPNCVVDICRKGYSLNSYIEKGGDVDGK